MAMQLLVSTPAALADSSYGFFKTFPRELRDAVYDLLYQEVTANVEGLHFHTRTVLVELRLISRQFRSEYDERSAADEQNNHLTITDDVKFNASGNWADGQPSGVPMYFPALATRSTHLTLNLTSAWVNTKSTIRANLMLIGIFPGSKSYCKACRTSGTSAYV